MKRFLLLAAVVAMGGCAANVNVKQASSADAPMRASGSAQTIVLNLGGSATATGSEDWPRLREVWQESMQSIADESGAAFSMQNGAPQATGQRGVLVVVRVENFRYVSTGKRLGLGIMSGNATLDAKATLRDLADGHVLAERSYNTSSSAWQGIFSAMTAKQVDAINRQIVAEAGSAAQAGDH